MYCNITVRDLRPNRSADARSVYRLSQIDDNCMDLYQYFVKKFNNTTDFVLTLTDNTPLCPENFKDVMTDDLELHIYETLSENVMKCEVDIAPHPDTITKSGMYEYYDSRGIDSVVISIAELIDNSLAATKDNDGLRLVEIRYYDYGSDSLLVIIDNGCGMGRNDLTNWAKFKCSKFVRNGANNESNQTHNNIDLTSFNSSHLPLSGLRDRQSMPPPSPRRMIRYLDSNINYFGAGGKQAIFNIGETTTMITKAADEECVFELTLSKSKFDEKTRINPSGVYKEELIQRTKGSERPLKKNPTIMDQIENSIIIEIENDYKSFTICCIKDVFAKHHIQFKRNTENMNYWTKGLARVYHYYLHGPDGNKNEKQNIVKELQDINIIIKIFQIKLEENIETQLKHQINLKDINDDYESLLIRSAKDSFLFEVEHSDRQNSDNMPAVIEGVIRYHPYEYDSETIPELTIYDDLTESTSVASSRTIDEDIEDCMQKATRKKMREVFECFWHGRLIPQDCIDFEWNKYNPKNTNCTKELEECYNRLSGALFTDACFQVSQNKQSFMDLNRLMSQTQKLVFYKVDGQGRRVRCNFENEFMNWLKNCHTKLDKQVHYFEYQCDIPRVDIQSLRKLSITNVFSVFNKIEWRNKFLKKGDIIQTQHTRPQKLIGKIDKFLVPVKCSGDYIGSPGFVEIHQLPEEIYGNGSESSKIIHFIKINIEAELDIIGQELDKLYCRLPESIKLTFPKRYPIKEGDQLVAGRPIGDIRVELLNSNSEKLQTDRIPYKGTHKKLSIQLEILREIENNETVTEIEYPLAHYSKDWDYWFTQTDGINKAGKYQIVCVCLNSTTGTDSSMTAKFANGDALPSLPPMKFTVIPDETNHFVVSENNLKVMIGKPFNLTLELFDQFDNLVKPDSNTVYSPEIKHNDFIVNVEATEIKGHKLILKNVVILGKIMDNIIITFEISLMSIENKEKLDIEVQLGNPIDIIIEPNLPIEAQNNSIPEIEVYLHDMGGNDVTLIRRNHNVVAKVFELIDNEHKKQVFPEINLVNRSYDNHFYLTINKQISIKESDIPLHLRTFVIKFFLKYDINVFKEISLVLLQSNLQEESTTLRSNTKDNNIKVSKCLTTNNNKRNLSANENPDNIIRPKKSKIIRINRNIRNTSTSSDMISDETPSTSRNETITPQIMTSTPIRSQTPLFPNESTIRAQSLNSTQTLPLTRVIPSTSTVITQVSADPNTSTTSISSQSDSIPLKLIYEKTLEDGRQEMVEILSQQLTSDSFQPSVYVIGIDSEERTQENLTEEENRIVEQIVQLFKQLRDIQKNRNSLFNNN
ncbi:structural maintenance of chromosomes flexible hinge domain-containing protein 1-like [Oppia nitens]|uniref:structural maintenance of chromosomes flexible hinge domain-containing protein 1-like n=1 Tax=Oppia nitens TaxID=1686743 RepID=UPI0023DBD476|nr:structural maintenance of chromosomes flexible hinge domain-containing protein 1-like [Oppia nitens]